MKNKSLFHVFTNGLLNENPTFRLLLGMCPTLAISTAASSGVGMGLATTFVLVFSNMVISMLRHIIPERVRIPGFIVVIATFVTIIDLMKYDSVFADGANENWFYILRFIAVFAAVVGHIFPIFANFRGGKGVATLVGAIMGVNAPLVLLCFGVWFLVLMVTHYVSLASMVAGCSFPIFTLISPKVNHLVPFVVFSFIIAILLIYTHRKNIERLKAGTESKIYIWKPRHVKVDPEEAKDKGANK